MNTSANNVTVDDLRGLHHEITRSGGLIDFTKKVRQPGKAELNHSVKVKRVALEALFANKAVWEQEKTGNGHAKYTCKLVPGVHIGFPKHGDNEVYDDILEGILKNVQEIINISCDQVFQIQGWNIQPNFERSAEHHKSLYPNLKIKNTNLNLN